MIIRVHASKYFRLNNIKINFLLFLLSVSLAVGSCNDVQINKSKTRKEITPDFFRLTTDEILSFSDTSRGRYFMDSYKNCLYIIPYTDQSLTTAILCKYLPESYSDLAKFEGINLAKPPISLDTIQSVKGITLGLSFKQVQEILGSPDSNFTVGTKSEYFWSYNMQETDTDTLGGFRPFVLNGLEFYVQSSFIKDSLKCLIYSYEVP